MDVRLIPRAGHRPAARLEHLPHAAFALLVGAAVVSLLTSGGDRCPYTLALIGVLAALYSAGLVWWERIGRCRPLWLAALVVVWLVLVLVAPPSLRAPFAWCAVPLTCVALRVLPPAAAAPVVAVSTGVLTLSLLGGVGLSGAGPAQPDAVVAPLVALWTTAALYHRQQGEAARRQRLIGALRRTRDELGRQQREAGILAERARIARDLHDSLTQELAAGRMLLQAAERDWLRRPQAARERVGTVVVALGATLAEARRMIADLVPPALDGGDLDAALSELCAQAQAVGAAAQVCFLAGEPHPPLPPEVAATVLRVTQGALANAGEHAGATSIVVTLHVDDARVRLRVGDDGVGFAEGRTTGAAGRGHGLPVMRERLREHGGTLAIDSRPGRGTTLTATVPLEPADRHAALVAAAA